MQRSGKVVSNYKTPGEINPILITVAFRTTEVTKLMTTKIGFRHQVKYFDTPEARHLNDDQLVEIQSKKANLSHPSQQEVDNVSFSSGSNSASDGSQCAMTDDFGISSSSRNKRKYIFHKRGEAYYSSLDHRRRQSWLSDMEFMTEIKFRHTKC